ncbi:MAG: fumarylacetoacetate hydrolase family protein [Planctomycetia bacterium]|nr:fumarylacetoacetate hydrolase family protein [Planctomycetia bacterium]
MNLAKFLAPNGKTMLGVVEGDVVRPLALAAGQYQSLTEILESNDPAETVRFLIDPTAASFARTAVTFLPPIDNQEIWAAGVTYKRSRSARMEESVSSATVYDLVYKADRPELFFKASAPKVVGHEKPVRIRKDSTWNVPEPELALVIDRRGQIVGYTIGNDMSSRDIEGENPLYLPQAKVYDESCSLGPWITLQGSLPSLEETVIGIDITRGGKSVFSGQTTAAEIARPLPSLVEWLCRENTFPHGAVLLTGTGVVPDKDFTLLAGDVVSITIAGIGTLTNPVVQRK